MSVIKQRTGQIVRAQDLPEDARGLLEFFRSSRALLAKFSAIPAGKDGELDTLRALVRRWQPRVDHLEGEGETS